MTDDALSCPTPNLPAVVPPVGSNDDRPTGLVRDAGGRFLAGNGGGGRRRGSRNRLTETMLSSIADHYAEHGKAALDKLATDDPASYLRIIASFVPREPLRDDFGDLSDEEVCDVVARAERHRLVERVIEAGEKAT